MLFKDDYENPLTKEDRKLLHELRLKKELAGTEREKLLINYQIETIVKKSLYKFK